ncbi:MAG: hypothetical protein KDC85_12050 [Saprospiraceae bacterium]|nr:hypothetical protein [Saprospiraceae bacterium]MCB9326235.1 hypothetical protein [Lewinellaceae bacterium]
MYTNNTIKGSLARLSYAIQNLEIISHEWSIPILRFLRSNDSVDFIQLQHETNLPPIILQKQIDALQEVGIVKISKEKNVRMYEMDHYKMLRIQLMVKQLIDQPIQIYDNY